MSASRTESTSGAKLRFVPGLGLADFEGAGLPEALAEKVEGELEIFSANVRHGLLDAAINVGLGVFSQLLAAEVTEIAWVKGRHDPERRAPRHGVHRRHHQGSREERETLSHRRHAPPLGCRRHAPCRGAVPPGERLPPARPPRRRHHRRTPAPPAPPRPSQLMTHPLPSSAGPGCPSSGLTRRPRNA